MANSGFEVCKGRAAGATSTEKVRGAATQQYYIGQLVKVVAGIATVVGATDKPTHVVQTVMPFSDERQLAVEMKTDSRQQYLLCINVTGGLVKMRTQLRGDAVPVIYKAAAQSNATPTTVIVPFTGAADDDFNDGFIYCHELNEVSQITDGTGSANVETFTVSPAFSRAVTVGDTITAVPWCHGKTAVRLNATDPSMCMSVNVAGKTGGQMKIEELDFNTPRGIEAVVSVPDLE